MYISSHQCVAARSGLGMSRDALADMAGVSARTINDFERGVRDPINATKASLQSALESAGAVFEPEGGVTLTAQAIGAFRNSG